MPTFYNVKVWYNPTSRDIYVTIPPPQKKNVVFRWVRFGYIGGWGRAPRLGYLFKEKSKTVIFQIHKNIYVSREIWGGFIQRGLQDVFDRDGVVINY